jgi:DNA-binding transcriptional ArsR family regulator
MLSDALNAAFSALADPTRRAILGQLSKGELSVKEISVPYPISAPAITKHLKVLEKAGLITRGRDAQRRPCRLSAEPLREVAEWVEQYRQHWDERLDRLDLYLRQLQQPSTDRRKREQRKK